MQQVIPEKIISIRNEIYRDVYNKSEWVYVKLQSLFEIIGRLFLDLSLWDNEFASTDPTGYAIFNYLEHRYIKNPKLANQFAALNEKANIIKHNTDPDRLQTAKFDISFVSFCFNNYNKYTSKLLKPDDRRYWLDLSILSDVTTVVVKPVIDENHVKVQKPAVKFLSSHIESREFEYQIFCGSGKQDYGFKITGLPENPKCSLESASIYATIFGFLLRSINVQKSSYIKDRETRFGKVFDQSKIFRYQIILLLLIRSNYSFDSTLTVFPIDESDLELTIAADSIMDYGAKISELSGVLFTPIKIIINRNGIKISASNDISAEIRTVNFSSRQQDTTRTIWVERTIKYCIKDNDNHYAILEALLYDFFGYEKFKPGQYKALVHMLNYSDSTLCIMPTGGGKSLIYYFLALLQPGPSIIVAPTRVLIADQIRNMRILHQIDDIQTISTNDLYEKGHFSLGHKFIFLTPSDFQHYALIYKVIELNQNRMISGIFLDEIHAISNWSHDFRPDYLMLSFNLLTFADHPRLYGFTATANYRVVKD
ncbi:MAG: DEAD/DEAH box helicase, partial [Clostridiaceae bacterium]|nr:DEAD/DEAH box helicase [Clostridiaceae bacterium]